MSVLMIWIAIVLFDVGFFIVNAISPNKPLWHISIGWFLILAGFVMALMQGV